MQKSKVTITQLIRQGLIKPPLRLSKTFKGSPVRATLLDSGKVKYEDREYKSLSHAAAMALNSVTGTKKPVNGWKFWKFLDKKSQKYLVMAKLRDQYLDKTNL